MSDYISRQAAIDAIEKHIRTAEEPYQLTDTDRILNHAFDVAASCVYNLPSAQPEQRWIPCSERLPDAEDCPMDCMVTRRSKYVGNYTDMAVAEADGTWTHENWKAITIKGKATCISTRDADIIAWMPLPEPYKGEERQ